MPTTELPKDVMAQGRRLIIFDVNGVLLKAYTKPPRVADFDLLPEENRARVVKVNNHLWCAVRPADAEQVLLSLSWRAYIMIWSCYRRPKLMLMLQTCLPLYIKRGVIKGIIPRLFSPHVVYLCQRKNCALTSFFFYRHIQLRGL